MTTAPLELKEALKTEKGLGPLSDDTQAAIIAQADKELKDEEAAKAGDKKEDKPAGEIKPKEEEVKSPAEEEEAKRVKEEADRKAAEDKAAKDKTEAQKKTDETIMSKKDEDLTADEKTRKEEIVKTHEAAFTEEVKAYATVEKLSEEEARAVLESERKILEKYQSDPKKLVRAYRQAQAAYNRLETKTKAELEKAASVVREDEVVIGDKKMKMADAKEQMVEAFRDHHSGKSVKVGEKEMAIDEMDDDQVFELAKNVYQSAVKAQLTKVRESMGKEAEEKRFKLLKDLPDSSKDLKPIIEKALKYVPDDKVLDSEYELEDIVSWAKGQFYTPEKLKEIEDAAFKRGQENAKILGEKSPGGGDGSTGKPKKAASELSPDEEVASLDEKMKARALEMFNGIAIWDEQRKYKEFIDHLKSVGEWPVKK